MSIFTTKSDVNQVRYGQRNREFSEVLTKRVFGYFKDKGITKYANTEMHIKSFILIALIWVPWAFILSDKFHGIDLLLLQWVMHLFGFIMWVGIAHDAHHDAYTPNKYLNKFLMFLGDTTGVSSYVMDYNHVKAHHSAVNIPHNDVSIDSFGVMRFHPGVPWKPYHRYQYLYIWPLYGISSLFKLFLFDFFTLKRKSIGAFRIKKHPWYQWIYMLGMKSFAIYITLILPLMLVSVPAWQIVAGFISGHFVAGVFLGVIFQVTHLSDYSMFTETGKDNELDNTFISHVMENTSSFSTSNRWMNWFTGGLNNHTIHHAFPTICQIHFPDLNPILRATAKEYGVPFKEYPTMGAALKSHVNMLRKLGQPGTYQPEPFEAYSLNSDYQQDSAKVVGSAIYS
jgi:linoleoyl-CoA desaturase